VIYVFTHDSIGLGEDGPTHQPIEHLAALRAMPNILVLRPADGPETAESWRAALQYQNGPSLLVLTRQKTALLDRDKLAPASGTARGGYVLAEAEGGAPRVILIGTGSEVGICVTAREQLQQAGIPTRVVSMPSVELFRRQDAGYQEQVLPKHVAAKVAVEAASPYGWREWVGDRGAIVGIETFGASAPFERIYQEFGITPEKVAATAKGLL
jgi:transketolase